MSKEDNTKDPQTPSGNGAAAPQEDAAAPNDEAAGDAADTPEGGEAGDLQQQLAAAQQEVAELKDNLLRAAAELENVRRRSEKKINDAFQFALTDFALAVGEVRDCLEAALDSANADQQEKMREGVELTLRKLVSAMDARHILPITPDIGAPFDPAIHMAIGQMPASKQAAANTVAAVIQAGYMLNGRVIRAANVMVAIEVEAGGDEDDAAEDTEKTEKADKAGKSKKGGKAKKD